MRLSRRSFLTLASAAPGAAVAAGVAPALPDASSFALEGTYLDAAFIHPYGRFAVAAAAAYADTRLHHPKGVGPRINARRAAVERFATLVNADPKDIAVVPSTLEGENLVNAALGVGLGAGVTTDAGHYDGALALYAELARRGTPVEVVRPVGGRIDLTALDKQITAETRLVAVSLVSSSTGFTYDLAELCALAHRKGALVYVDVIQAAGAMPIDVKASGVDFACCGLYKWLMGDFGAAFLYVRPDRLDRLKRPEVGWRQIKSQESHVLPLETPGPALGPFTLGSDAASIFEVSTPAWGALAVAVASLDHVLGLGVETIAAHRRPLVERLRHALPPKDFIPLTPEGGHGPLVCFAVKDAKARYAARLEAAGVTVSVYDQRLRISPSVYNTAEDIDRLVGVLTG